MTLQNRLYIQNIANRVLSEEDSPEQKAYKDLFNKILKKYGADSPNDISKDKKDDFFDEVEREWAKHPDNKKDDGESASEGMNEYGGSTPNKKKKEKKPMSESLSETYRRGFHEGMKKFNEDVHGAPGQGGTPKGNREDNPIFQMAPGGFTPPLMGQDTPYGEIIGNYLAFWGYTPTDYVAYLMDLGLSQQQAIQMTAYQWSVWGLDYSAGQAVGGEGLGNLLAGWEGQGGGTGG
jgi:hypothetical protein